MREAVFEVLERINQIEGTDARIQAIQDASVKYGRLVDALYYGLSKNVKFDLPEGEPPFKPTDEINSHSIFWSEIRRVYLFLANGKNLTALRRQELFINMLEVLHPKDATLLLLMKDRKWPFDNIDAKFVNKVFPGLLKQVVIDGGARREA